MFNDLFEKLRKRNVNALKTGSCVFEFMVRYGKTLEKLEALKGLFDSERTTKGKIKGQKTMLYCAIYLFVFDLYVAFLDIAILLLILDQHDVYNPLSQKYVHTLEEIGRVDIETKFKFLREHNLESLIRTKDQELRNKIAHNNFDLADDENVVILYKGKKYFVKEQSQDLLEFCINLTMQLDTKHQSIIKSADEK